MSKDYALLYAEALRAFVLKDYSASSDILAKLCETTSENFGESSLEYGNALLLYGKCLYELGKTEEGLINPAPELKDPIPNEEDVESVEENKEDDNVESQPKTSLDKNNIKNGDTEEARNCVDESHVLPTTQEETNSCNSESEEDDGESSHDESKNELSSFELSWEVLEIASTIFRKHTDKQNQLKLAEIYLKLGEISLENGNYEVCIDDLLKSLQLYKDWLEPHARVIASVHYTLAIAYSLFKMADPAIQQVLGAIQITQKKIDYLKEENEKLKENSVDLNSNLKEITELLDLLDELNDKKADFEDMRAQEKMAIVQNLSKEPRSLMCIDSPRPSRIMEHNNTGSSFSKSTAIDISHLVRKPIKRDFVSDTKNASKVAK